MKCSVLCVVVLFAAVAFAGQTEPTPHASKQDKTASAPTPAKQEQLQGHILRINKGNSTIDIRGGRKNLDQTQTSIHYDESTEWTKLGKPAEMSEFKEGSFVIIMGQSDKKGVVHATRIDLRLPR